MKKKSIIEVFLIIVLVAVLACLVMFIIKNDKEQEDEMKQRISNTTETAEEKKSVKKIDLNKSTVIDSSEINLEDYSTDITIKNAGNYTLYGSFKNAVIVDTEKGETTLTLNGVTIENKKTAAIIGLSGDGLKINTENNSENNLSDGGNSQYDACIYSEINLVIDGDGMLNVNGKNKYGIEAKNSNITINMGRITVESEDDGICTPGDKSGTVEINHATVLVKANGDGIDSDKNIVINSGIMLICGGKERGNSAIDTKKGYVINGGTVITLSTSSIEKPSAATQNVCIWSLDKAVKANTLVSLTNKDDEEIISFMAPTDFQTLIISTDYISTGTYKLYQGGEHTGTLAYNMYSGGEYIKGDNLKVDKRTEFTINQDGTTTFGRLQ